ncbi:MAG: lytic transglycosylase domain-containing protein [Chitinophagaceae bacterium]|nr:MAG: lytic transglycosylase domain-containing protein [Chitinophagaceae bacterium]
MFKTIWVLSVALLFTQSELVAAPTNSFKSDTSDLLLKVDSLKPSLAVTIPADPKEGFKDLFVASSSSVTGTMELNPMAITFVEDYMERFQKSMDELKDWGRPYFDMMDGILESHNLPKELKYLAVIESNLKSGARSWAGAVGPWQFMPTTARNMGLKVGRKIDERRDLAKSTHAASKYLNNLFNLYGDWLLVIAAYNSGPGTVNSAIRRSGSRDFWTLQNYLPLESRNHVKKFIATHYMLEGTGGITTLTKSEALEYTTRSETLLSTTAKTENISGRYNSGVLVRHIAMELAEFNRINPQFDKQISLNGKYELHLPADKMAIFLNRKFDILAESVYLLLNTETASSGTGK